MKIIGIITDIEYDTDTNEIKNIDIAIQDSETNKVQIIIVTDYDKKIEISPNQFEDSDYDLFDPVEYLPGKSKIRKLISPTPIEGQVSLKILNSILNDDNLPGVEDIRTRFWETYCRRGDELNKPGVPGPRQR